MITGTCLCGGIRYEYDGDINEVSMCHCALCRKAQGSAFVAVSPIDAARFRITSGVELLKEYRAVANKARVFCANCGSPIYSFRESLPDIKRLRLGTIDTPFTCKNTYHTFVSDKAAWDQILDDYPQHSGFKR